MSKPSSDDLAFAAFIQALSVAILNFDDVSPEHRTTENFMIVFNGYLEAILEEYESEGEDIARNLDFIRVALNKGLSQIREIRRKNDKPS